MDGLQNIAIRISVSYYFITRRKVDYLEVGTFSDSNIFFHLFITIFSTKGKKPKPDSASTSVEKVLETEETT